MIEKLIRKILNEEFLYGMKLNEDVKISDDLKYHIENNIPLNETVFRIYSESYFNLINEVRDLYNLGYIELNKDDKWLVESDLGKSVILESGEVIRLDAPFEIEEPICQKSYLD